MSRAPTGAVRRNFSGDGFSDMHFPVHAVPPDNSPSGSAKTKGAGPALDAQSLRRTGKAERSGRAVYLRLGRAGLFEQIVGADATPARNGSRFDNIVSAGVTPDALCHTSAAN